MSLTTPLKVEKLQRTLRAKAKSAWLLPVVRMRTRESLVREPDAGNPQVRFDERGVETE